MLLFATALSATGTTNQILNRGAMPSDARSISLSALTNDDNNPPNPPIITGPLSGRIKETYVYNITVTDPDEDDYLLELEIDFGDGIIVERCGCDTPWENGETIEIEHRWEKSDTYEITGRVMDVYGEWSNWSDPLVVSMPKNKPYINTPFLQFLENFFEKYPNAFPILRHLIGL